MKKISTYFMVFLMMMGISVNAQDLVISGVVDGDLPGGLPKAIEIYVINDIADLSAYGLGSANNGGGSDGEEFTFPADAASEGDYIYVASEAEEFANFFGFTPNYTSDAANINGDDAIELFMGGSVIDVYGEIDVNGDGEPWDYTDGWAYRNDGTGPDGTTFQVGSFSYSGLGGLEDETSNSTAANPWPLATYTAGAATQVSTPIITPGTNTYTEPITVTMSCGTADATIYYTTDGSDPDNNDDVYSDPGFQVSTTTTVRAKAYKAGLDPSNIASVVYTFPTTTQVANIAELRAQTADEGDIYELTGQAILTFQQDYRGQKYIQDATAAILIDDYDGNITTSYNLYDGITGITGELVLYGGMLQFVPISDPGAATSSGNSIAPQVVTLDDLQSGFEDYEAELIKVEGCVFTDAGATFETGEVYPISDGSKAIYNFRTTFYAADYIDTEIPSTPMDLVMLPNSRTDGEYVSSRSLSDMSSGAANPATQLTINSVNGGEDVYENQAFSVSVQALDSEGNVTVVDADVAVTLSVGTGSGSLGGTTSGTIASGTSSVTINGVTYGPHENGVVLDVNGGGLTQGSSPSFDVLEVVIPDLLFTEVMYNAIPGTDTLEYIEIYNNGTSAINLENYQMTKGVVYTFGAYTLNPGEYLLLAARAELMQSVYGVTALEWTSGGLNNSGEEIELSDPDGNVITYIDYQTSDPWPAKTTGKSIRFCDYNQAQNVGENWSLSVEFIDTYEGTDLYGSPGAACGADPLIADFVSDPNPATIEIGESVDFTDLSQGVPTGWSWEFTGGTPATSTDQNPANIVYAAEGEYTVTLTVTRDGESDSETKTAYVTVVDPTEPPVADFSADLTSIEIGQSIQFSDLSTGEPTSWTWTFDGGTPETSNDQNPNVTYNSEGVYDVTLVVANSAGSNELTKTAYITVIDPTIAPVAEFTANNTTVFVGQAVQFTDLSENEPTDFNWIFESGTPSSSSTQNPLVTYNTPGIFDVSLYVENSAGNDEITKTDYITVLPATVGDLVITEIMYNPPESGDDSLEYIEIYNNSDDEVNLLGYTFTAGVEFVFPNMSLENGEYLVIAGNAQAFQNTFGFEPLEWEGALANGGELIRLSSPAGITVDSVAYGNSAPWPSEANGGGSSMAICDPETENSVGENWHASVNYLATNEDGDDIYGSPYMASAPVSDFEANITELIGTGNVEFTELSICNATSFEWEFEGGTPATSTEANPIVTYDMAGDFDVTLTVSNATGSHSMTMEEYIHVGVGIAQASLNEVSVMPNPSNGIFKLVNPSQEDISIKVFGILGNQILEKQNITNEEMIDLTEQQGGVYLLQIQMGEQVKSIRLIKR